MNPKLENIVRHTPLPVAGLAFGITGLGGLFAEFGQGAWAKPVFGVLGAALLIIVLLKALFLPQNLKANLQHPVQAAVATVIPFAFMLDAAYLSSSYPNAAAFLWLFSLIAVLIYLAWFNAKYILHLQIKQVFAAYFIPFVGFCVPVMTSHHLTIDWLPLQTIRYGLFALSAIGFVVMFIVITLRYLKVPVEEISARPVFAIYTAPLAMLIVGYARLLPHGEHSAALVWVSLILSQLLFVMVLSQVPSYLKNGFFPSYAALTFPFIITANSLFEGLRIVNASPVWFYLAYAEGIFAIVMTLFVLVKYLQFFQKIANNPPQTGH